MYLRVSCNVKINVNWLTCALLAGVFRISDFPAGIFLAFYQYFSVALYKYFGNRICHLLQRLTDLHANAHKCYHRRLPSISPFHSKSPHKRVNNKIYSWIRSIIINISFASRYLRRFCGAFAGPSILFQLQQVNLSASAFQLYLPIRKKNDWHDNVQ